MVTETGCLASPMKTGGEGGGWSDDGEEMTITALSQMSGSISLPCMPCIMVTSPTGHRCCLNNELP